MSSEVPSDPPDEKPYDKPSDSAMSSEAAFDLGVGIMMWAIIILFFAGLFVPRRIWRNPVGFFRRRWRRSSTERPPSHLRGQEPSRARNVGSDSAILGTLPMSSPGRLPFHFTREEPSSVQNVRLDSAILETLPTFVIESPNFNDLCTVCQYAFEENEKARLLPNCGHIFHVDCIDEWFDSDSTCPVCRTGAKPEQPILESARIEQVSDTISERITSGIHDNLNSEQGQSASSGEEFNLQNPTAISSSGRQKQMNAEMDEGTSAGRGFSTRVEAHRSCSPIGSQSSSRSPVTRLRSPNGSQSSSRSPVIPVNSPTSIASRDRESIPVLPSDHPAECNGENNDQ